MRQPMPSRNPFSENNLKIRDAKSAISTGNFVKARELLLEVTDADNYSSEAWSLLAEVVETVDEKIICLENVCLIEESVKDLSYWQAHITLLILKRLNGDATPRESLERVLLDSIQNLIFLPYEISHLWEYVRKIGIHYFWQNPLDTFSADFIIIKDYETILYRQGGIFQRHNTHFQSPDHLQAFCDLITVITISSSSKPIIHTYWMNDFIHIVTSPLVPISPLILIQKRGLMNEKYLPSSTFLSEKASIEGFIRACVRSRINMLIIGEHHTDTTQLMNELAHSIYADERIISLERFMQYQFSCEHVIPLEHNIIMHEADDFVLRMRPDRVIFGDLWMSDIPHFIQTALAGVNIMGRLRARTVESALWQLEIALMNAYPQLPLSDARNMLSSDLQLVILVKRLPNGIDKITEVSEIIRNDTDNSIGIHPIYSYNPQTDTHESTDYLPRITTRFGLDWD